MGNNRSTETVPDEDIFWSNGEKQTKYQEMFTKSDQKKMFHDSSRIIEREQRKKELEEDFVKFKQELARKHERRREIIRDKKKEMFNLKDELVNEKEENQRLRRLLEKSQDSNHSNNSASIQCESTHFTVNKLKEENEELLNEVEKLRLLLKEKDVLADKNKELRISLAEMQRELQSVNTEVISFEKERIDYQEHVTALKDIIKVSKEMLSVRESQIEELKKKITSIEELLASKEMSILSDDLRHEYERQLRNIRDLRSLYDERQRADKREKENLQSQIDDLKKNVEDEQNKNGELTERVEELEQDNSKKYDKIVSLESNFGLAKAECKDLHAEMETINQLFSQILISFNNDQDIDLDNMVKMLEENHDLLTNIVINDESGDTSALPKVLLDLVNQVNESKKDSKDVITPLNLENLEAETVPQLENTDKLDTIKEETELQLSGTHQLNSPEEIVENLPKVWRVLIELLSHQSPPNNEIAEKKGENDNHCYKSVETPTGLREVLSVSKTFIRLKSLILEKKSLEKERNRLKQLNTHLEGRLSDQEKRLVLVSNELSKTWNFVGKMQKQHQQLHTQEKILRYELAQKRKLLTELKEELEYCRQKWSQARQQNSSTEEQWKQLRTEFASRKRNISEDVNNSVESGYSDDKSSSDEDDTDFGDKTQAVEQIQNEENQARISNTNLESVGQEVPLSTEVPNSSEGGEDQSVKTENINSTTTSANEQVLDPEMVEIEKLCLDVESSSLAEPEIPSVDVSHSLEVQKTDLDFNCDVKRQNEDSQPALDDQAMEKENVTNELLVSVSEQNTCIDNVTLGDNCDVPSQSEDLQTQSVEDIKLIEEENGINELVALDSEQNTGMDSVNLDDNCDAKKQNEELQTQSVTDTTQVMNEEKVTNELLVPDSEQYTGIDSANNASVPIYNQKANGEATKDKCFNQPSLTDSNESTDLEKPSTSNKSPTQAVEEFVARREKRMKKLEEQCSELFSSVAKTSLRGMAISFKLDNLHEAYGEGNDNSQTTSSQDQAANSQVTSNEELATSMNDAEKVQENCGTAQEETSPIVDSMNGMNNQE